MRTNGFIFFKGTFKYTCMYNTVLIYRPYVMLHTKCAA